MDRNLDGTAGDAEDQPNSAQTERFLALYSGCETQLHGYLLALLGNQPDADEAFQDTVLVLWRRFGDFEPGSSFIAWAKGIAFHKALHLRQKRSRYSIEDNSFLEVIDAAIANEPDGMRLRIQMLEQCLEKLGVPDRDLVNARYGSDRKIVDYAKELGRPVNTVYKSLERIRRVLVECVERSLAAEARQ